MCAVNKYKVMFVCHGNICRSPMAEYIFNDLAKQQGVAHRFVASSAATSSEEICGTRGNPIYPPAKAQLERHGIACDGKRAVQLQKSDYDRYDLFVGMDNANVRNMLRIFGGDADKKVCKLLDFADGGEVADPWYSRDFDTAYRTVFAGCSALLCALRQQNQD